MIINDFLAADMRKQMQADGYDLLDEFHAASKVGARFIGWDRTGYEFSSRPEAHDFKIANVKRRNGIPPLALPEPSLIDARLDDLRTRRKSTRRFRRSSVCLRNLGTLLNHGYGFATDDRRSVPSGGAVYPLELYVIALNVTGLPTGTYHYLPHEHALERCASDDSQPTLAHALNGAFDEGQAGFPAFHIVVTARSHATSTSTGYAAIVSVYSKRDTSCTRLFSRASRLISGRCRISTSTMRRWIVFSTSTA